MITTLLLLTLLTAREEQVVTRKVLPDVQVQENLPDWIESIEPDVVPRGRATRIVVAGQSADALKTLRIEPPDGVRVSGITPLAPRAGAEVVAVDLIIDATAQPGERQVVLLVKPDLAALTPTRPGGGSEIQREIDKMFEEMANERDPVEAATIYINSHNITVTAVTAAGDTARITVSDSAGDFVLTPSRPDVSSGGLVAITRDDDPVESETRCGNQISHGLLMDSKVMERKGSDAVMTATIGLTAASGTCDLRVRVRDQAGNRRPWFTTKVTLR